MININDLLSPVVTAMPPSGIRKFFDIVSEMKDAISLGVGEPDFSTPSKICEAGIHSLETGHTHYTSNSGLIELRDEICTYVKRKYNVSYTSKEVLITVGGSEAIDLLMRSILSAGDEVLIPEPSFVCYKPCTVLAGGVPVPIVTKEEDNFRLMPHQLKAAITDKTKLLILPFPNNPTGAVMSKEDLKAIADVLEGTNILVLSDEIYSELNYTDEGHTSFASIGNMKERTILINGFSKAFAMTGWRLGYACGDSKIIAAMTKVHQFAIMSAPTVSQYAAISALKYCDEEVKAMTTQYNRRRRMMVNGFRKMGLECFEPLGAFYVFPNIKKTGLSSEEFCQRLLYEEKVAVVPGTAFGSCGEGFVRCSYAYSINNITEALKRIDRFVQKTLT